MSTFYGELLDDSTVDTNVRISSNNNIRHVRAHIMRDGFLTAGQLELSIYDGANLLNISEIDYTELNDISTEAYLHGWVRFDIPTSLSWEFDTDYSEYTIKIRYKNKGTGNVWLVSDLNDPIVDLHDSVSIYVRGFEVYVSRQF